jgi:hypothetical protein
VQRDAERPAPADDATGDPALRQRKRVGGACREGDRSSKGGSGQDGEGYGDKEKDHDLRPGSKTGPETGGQSAECIASHCLHSIPSLIRLNGGG